MNAITNHNNAQLELTMIDNKLVNTDPNNEVDIMLANYVFTMLEALPVKSLEIIADALDKAQKISKAGTKIRKEAENKGVCPADLTLEIVEKFIPLEKQDEESFFEKELSDLREILDNQLNNSNAKKAKYEYSFRVNKGELVPENQKTRSALSEKYLKRETKKETQAYYQKIMVYALEEIMAHNARAKFIHQRVQINQTSFKCWIKEGTGTYFHPKVISDFIKSNAKQIKDHNKHYCSLHLHFNNKSLYYRENLKKWQR